MHKSIHPKHPFVRVFQTLEVTIFGSISTSPYTQGHLTRYLKHSGDHLRQPDNKSLHSIDISFLRVLQTPEDIAQKQVLSPKDIRSRASISNT